MIKKKSCRSFSDDWILSAVLYLFYLHIHCSSMGTHFCRAFCLAWDRKSSHLQSFYRSRNLKNYLCHLSFRVCKNSSRIQYYCGWACIKENKKVLTATKCINGHWRCFLFSALFLRLLLHLPYRRPCNDNSYLTSMVWIKKKENG